MLKDEELQEIRREIDDIDRNLLHLFNRRMTLSQRGEGREGSSIWSYVKQGQCQRTTSKVSLF